jgi:hypothetical protein
MDDILNHNCEGIKKDGNVCGKVAKYYVELDNKKYLCGSHCKKYGEGVCQVKKPNVNKFSILEINKRLVKELDKYPEFVKVDQILIENQGVLNQRMMKISAFLHNYFVIRGIVDNPETPVKKIAFIPAYTKLKFYDGPEFEITVKTKYAKKKKLSIGYCNYYLQNDKKHFEYWQTHKKKDDLAESFLNGLNYLNNNTKQKKKKKVSFKNTKTNLVDDIFDV